MLKDHKMQVTAYHYRHNNFIVEIIKDSTGYAAYLQGWNCGIKELMFGMNKKQNDGTIKFDDFLDIVEWNLNDYEESYTEEWMKY